MSGQPSLATINKSQFDNGAKDDGFVLDDNLEQQSGYDSGESINPPPHKNMTSNFAVQHFAFFTLWSKTETPPDLHTRKSLVL